MHLDLQPPVATMGYLPVDLMPSDGGKFWLIGNKVYLWAGGRYVTATLPAPDPEHVVGRPPPAPVYWEAAAADHLAEMERKWNAAFERSEPKPSPRQQEQAVTPNPDPWMGLVAAIVLFVMSLTAGVVGVINHGWDGWSTANAVVNVATGGIISATLALRAQRRRAAMQLGPLSDDQPGPPAELEVVLPPGETREFQAASPCPSCGWLDAHRMREPDLDKDPDDATVIRECIQCQQEWGEK